MAGNGGVNTRKDSGGRTLASITVSEKLEPPLLDVAITKGALVSSLHVLEVKDVLARGALAGASFCVIAEPPIGAETGSKSLIAA